MRFQGTESKGLGGANAECHLRVSCALLLRGARPRLLGRGSAFRQRGAHAAPSVDAVAWAGAAESVGRALPRGVQRPRRPIDRLGAEPISEGDRRRLSLILYTSDAADDLTRVD